MSATDNPKLALVRKVLAKAEDPACTGPEAEALTAKAAVLIAKYGIDAALLAESDPDSDALGDRIEVIDAPYALDKSTLLHTVAGALRARTVLRTRYPRGVKQLSMHLFGYGADLDRVELLYTSLLVQAAHALAVEYVPRGQSPAAYRRSWYHGFSAAVGARLCDAEARAQCVAQADRNRTPHGAPARSVSLVLADRSVVAERAMHDAYPDLRPGRRRQLAGTGARTGYAAGQRADLGGVRVTRGAGAGRQLEGGGAA